MNLTLGSCEKSREKAESLEISLLILLLFCFGKPLMDFPELKLMEEISLMRGREVSAIFGIHIQSTVSIDIRVLRPQLK